MSKKILFLFPIIFVCACSTIVFASCPEYKEGELLVRFAPKPDGKQMILSEKNELLASINAGSIKHSYKLVPGLTLVKLPPDLSVEKALTLFKNAGGILYAEPNYRIKALAVFPNDPDFAQQWALHNTGQTHPVDCGGTTFGTPDSDIDAPQAWDIYTGISNIVVAVIDSGVDYMHPDLAANMWVNQAELNGNPGVDDDENDYIDDIYGYDFCNNDADPIDDCWHGTHCAGIIGAIGNNNDGVTGVCWNVKIMALKFLNSYGSGNTWDAIASIYYGINMGADILSNSWGGKPEIPEEDQELRNSIETANDNGVLVIAAAGNFGSDNDGLSPIYPSSYNYENIIAVMATDKNDERWILNSTYSSNYGATSVDLSAPGSDILTLQRYEDRFFGCSQQIWPFYDVGCSDSPYAGNTRSRPTRRSVRTGSVGGSRLSHV